MKDGCDHSGGRVDMFLKAMKCDCEELTHPGELTLCEVAHGVRHDSEHSFLLEGTGCIEVPPR